MHGGILNFLKNILFLAAIFNLNIKANSNIQYSDVGVKYTKQSINSFLLNKNLYINKHDIKAANNLETIFRLTENNYLNSHILNRTIKSVNKSSAFYSYRYWLIKLKKINSTSDVEKIINTCTKPNPSMNNVQKELNKNLRSFCNHRFLSLTEDTIKRKNRITHKQLSYLIKYFPNFIFHDNSNHFVDFMNSISSNKKIHQLISFKITDYLIEMKAIPSKEVISSMHITPALTQLVQLRGLDNNSTQNIFYNELKIMAENIYEEFENRNPKVNLANKINEIINFADLNQSYLPKSRTYNKLISLGKFILRRDYLDESRFLFKYTMRNYPKLSKESQFLVLWTHLIEEDYSNAYKFIKSINITSNFKKYDEQMLFWTSYVLEKQNKKVELEGIVEYLVQQNPLSYYSIMASKLHSNNKFYDSLIDEDFEKIPHLKYFSNSTIKNLKRVKILSSIDNSNLLNLEINSLAKSNENLGNSKIPKEVLKSSILIATSDILNKSKSYLLSFKTIYTALNYNNIKLNKRLLQILFPTPFFNRLKNISQKVDPFVLLSLIRQESGFNPQARSRVGARGLMQLMPATARQVASINRTEKLDNPYLNMKIGSQYFNYLFDKYDNNLVYTLSAYNAGEARVKRWQDKFFKNNSILHTIESIPFNETKKYVQLIFRNIFFYKLLNEKNEPKSSLPNKIFDVSLGFKR